MLLPPRTDLQLLEDDIVKQVCKSVAKLARHFSCTGLRHRGAVLSCNTLISVPNLSHTASYTCLQMEASMKKEGASTVLMLPTYVLRLPNG